MLEHKDFEPDFFRINLLREN